MGADLNCENTQNMNGCLHSHHTKQGNVKWRVGGGGGEIVAVHEEDLKQMWSHHHKPKYLQKCHSGQHNYKNVTIG